MTDPIFAVYAYGEMELGKAEDKASTGTGDATDEETKE